MNKFDVWKRKKDKREKTIPNDQALRILCDNIKATYPDRYTHPTPCGDSEKLFGKSVIEDLIPMQLNGASDDDMRGYLKVYWDK